MTVTFKGNKDLIRQDIVAVIGSRDASKEALQNAYRYSARLAESGVVIANGLAIGIDTEAVKGALSVHGKVIAVLPSSLTNIYPYRNKKLAEDIIANGGLLISQFTADTIEKRNFIERDITLANLANKVVIVDCKENSGTMYAVKRAITLGKPVEYLGAKKEFLDTLGCKQITKSERKQ